MDKLITSRVFYQCSIINMSHIYSCNKSCVHKFISMFLVSRITTCLIKRFQIVELSWNTFLFIENVALNISTLHIFFIGECWVELVLTVNSSPIFTSLCHNIYLVQQVHKRFVTKIQNSVRVLLCSCSDVLTKYKKQ